MTVLLIIGLVIWFLYKLDSSSKKSGTHIETESERREREARQERERLEREEQAKLEAEEEKKRNAVKAELDATDFTKEIPFEKIDYFWRSLYISQIFEVLETNFEKLYDGEFENLNLKFDDASLDIYCNVYNFLLHASREFNCEKFKNDFGKFLQKAYLFLFVRFLLLIDANGKISENTEKNVARDQEMMQDVFGVECGYYFDKGEVVDNIINHIALVDLPILFEQYGDEIEGTLLKRKIVRLASVPEPDNVKIITEHLDSDFKDALFNNAQRVPAAVAEIILDNTLCGCDVPKKYLMEVITESNALSCKNPDAVLKYYEVYSNANKHYLDLYCNCESVLRSVRASKLLYEDNKLNIQFKSDSRVTSSDYSGTYYITNSADVDYSVSGQGAELMNNAVSYESVTIAVPKAVLEKYAMNFDDMISALIVNHRKTNANKKIKQPLTIITDGEIKANTMAKIEDNFKKYTITQ